MQAEKTIICADCAEPIVGEYIVRKKNGKEEYYHPQCAKRTGALKLPVQIRFTHSRFDFDSRLNHNYV